MGIFAGKYLRFAYFIPGLMLFTALLPLPYSYYQLLRWVVFLSSGYFFLYLKALRILDMSLFQTKHKTELLAILAVIAIVFNPITPFHLTRSLWSVFNVLAGLFMLFHDFSYFINS